MRISVVEIGSRAVRFLVAEVAEGRVAPVSSSSRPISLGKALTGPPDELGAVVAQLKNAVGGFRADAKHAGATQFSCFGTEGLRKLQRQQPDAVRRIDEALQVLSPSEEAECSFAAGVTDEAVRAEIGQQYVVIDMGGGSIEVTAGALRKTGPAMSAHVSAPLGSQPLARQFADFGYDLAKLDAWIDETLSKIDIPVPGTAATTILLGGLPTKVAWLFVRRSEADIYNPKLVAGATLMRADMKKLAAVIHESWRRDPPATRRLVDPRTKDDSEVVLVIAGLSLLHGILVRQKRQTCAVSSRGARFGYAVLVASRETKP